MKLTQRIRLYMSTWGTRTVGQVVAAMSKHVTATQAIREFETIDRYRIATTKFRRPVRKNPVTQGRRIVVTKALRGMYHRGELARIAPGRYQIVKKI